MPSDETRRLLRMFGIVVTEFEDAVAEGAPLEKLTKLEVQVRTHLQEITDLIEQIAARKK